MGLQPLGSIRFRLLNRVPLLLCRKSMRYIQEQSERTSLVPIFTGRNDDTAENIGGHRDSLSVPDVPPEQAQSSKVTPTTTRRATHANRKSFTVPKEVAKAIKSSMMPGVHSMAPMSSGQAHLQSQPQPGTHGMSVPQQAAIGSIGGNAARGPVSAANAAAARLPSVASTSSIQVDIQRRQQQSAAAPNLSAVSRTPGTSTPPANHRSRRQQQPQQEAQPTPMPLAPVSECCSYPPFHSSPSAKDKAPSAYLVRSYPLSPRLPTPLITPQADIAAAVAANSSRPSAPSPAVPVGGNPRPNERAETPGAAADAQRLMAEIERGMYPPSPPRADSPDPGAAGSQYLPPTSMGASTHAPGLGSGFVNPSRPVKKKRESVDSALPPGSEMTGAATTMTYADDRGSIGRQSVGSMAIPRRASDAAFSEDSGAVAGGHAPLTFNRYSKRQLLFRAVKRELENSMFEISEGIQMFFSIMTVVYFRRDLVGAFRGPAILFGRSWHERGRAAGSRLGKQERLTTFSGPLATLQLLGSQPEQRVSPGIRGARCAHPPGPLRLLGLAIRCERQGRAFCRASYACVLAPPPPPPFPACLRCR